MVTGVYLPEINGAVRQCSLLIDNLAASVKYSVLTGTNDVSNSGVDYIDGVLVIRVFMPKWRKIRYIISVGRLLVWLVRLLFKTDLVHVIGFSKRNAIIITICRILNKKVILKMTSFGHDDPMSIRKNFPGFWGAFKSCHAYIGISPAFSLSYRNSDLPQDKYNFIPNGVDLNIYYPVSANKRRALRDKYGFTSHDKLIVFVGHFSCDKRPMLLYRAWVKLCDRNTQAKLIFIGHTKNHFEVDEGIVKRIKLDALHRGTLPRIHFVEETQYVDEYMKIADVFVLPSIREGLPNVLLEAMACALPCIVRDLPGVTDWLIDDGKTGVLFDSDDPDILTEKIRPYVAEPVQSRPMRLGARRFMESKFSCLSTSERVFDLYRKIMRLTS